MHTWHRVYFGHYCVDAFSPVQNKDVLCKCSKWHIEICNLVLRHSRNTVLSLEDLLVVLCSCGHSNCWGNHFLLSMSADACMEMLA